MIDMFARIRKALLAGLSSGLAALGIDVTGIGTLEWWQPIVVAVVTGFVTYWTKQNAPGTLLHATTVETTIETTTTDPTDPPWSGK